MIAAASAVEAAGRRRLPGPPAPRSSDTAAPWRVPAPPYKDGLGETVPTDPLIYRFYEIMQVYGEALKGVIHEEFGDGIMSAIDFQVSVDRKEDPKGDRVVVTMDGKFLPYRK